MKERSSFTKNGLSAAAPGERLPERRGNASIAEDIAGIIQWLDDMKTRNHMFQARTGLRTLADWSMDQNGHLAHRQGKFFKIIGLRVTSGSREVGAWTQPILDNVATGIIGLLVQGTGGAERYLMQAKAEVGNRNIVQIAPTVQFTQENYAGDDRLAKPFLFDEFSRPSRFKLLQESRQSEEGARFFQEQHIHRVLLMPDDLPLDIPPEFHWLSRREIGFFLHCGEQVNSCARSILATLV